MLYFETRSKARSFAAAKGRKVIDLMTKGISNFSGNRWAVKVL